MKKPRPSKRTSSSYVPLSDKESAGPETEDDSKDKDATWVRELKEHIYNGQETVKSLYQRYKDEDEFQQQVTTYSLMVASLLIFVVYLLTSSDPSVSSDSLVSAKSNSRVERILPKVIQLSKREIEQAEGLDLSGKSDLLSLKRKFTTDKELILEAQRQERINNPLSEKQKQCFRFGRTISRSGSGPLSYYAPKKVFDLPVLQRSLKKMGWSQVTELKRADLVLKGQPRISFRQLSKGKMYYDMVSALGRIGSKKKTQLATLRNHVKKFGCSFESLHIQPRSFDMNRPSDCRKFFAHADVGKMWVLKSCKNGEGSKGAGIEVIDDLSGKRTEFGSCEQNAMNYVAQEYIQQPLLVQGSKFDMRAYLFVASTSPYVVFFNPGYIRRSLAEYKPSSTKKNDVLTNYHVQMNREDFDPGKAMWSFPHFISYLQEEGLCQACGDIEIQLAKISKLVFDSGRDYYKRHPGSFQIVGLDFMMDENLNVFFIEGNVSPGLGSHKLKWKSQLMDDLVSLMYETTTLVHERPDEFDLRIGERVFGQNNNYWELIVHEKHEQCSKEFKFNPCKELKSKYASEVEEADQLEPESGEEEYSSDDY